MDTAIKRAEARLEYLSSDDETCALYEARRDARIEYNSGISAAKQEGKLEGMLEGKLEGKLEVAKALLDILDEQTIAKKTGLSVEEVQKLKLPQ